MPILDKSNKVQVAKYLEFLQSKEDISINQNFDFLSSNKNNNFEIVYLEKNGHFIASMALSIICVGKKYSILYCCKNPVCDVYNLKEVNELVEEANVLVNKYNAIMFVMDPEIEYDEKLIKLYKRKGFKVYSKLSIKALENSPSNCMKLNLREIDEKNILDSLQDKIRYYVETAEKRNVHIKVSTTQRELNKFIKMYEKESLPGFEDIKRFQTYKNLLKEFDDDIIRVYIASVDSTPLAAAIVCKYKGTVKCLDEVCVSDSSSIFGRAKMHYEIIKWGINSGASFYDMGEADEKDNRFKEGFATKEGFTKYIGKVCKVYNRLPLLFLKIKGGNV